ncbi:MAG: HAMP domain-containing sensor histidine kinase, partial [Evtepia sp.]
MLNTYPMVMTQNMMFQVKQTSLQSQTQVLANTLPLSEKLTPEGVAQAVKLLDDLTYTRILVTDEAGMTLFDTSEEPLINHYLLSDDVVSALRGNDVFHSEYRDGVFRAWASSPVMNRGRVVGAVYLYESDSNQGVFLQEIQSNLQIISLVVCMLVLILSMLLSNVLTRRIDVLLAAIRRVREGEYSHRVALSGRDELAQLAEEFDQLTLRLQTTEEARRRFVSDASHELKTPLASIRLLTDSILQEEQMEPALEREFISDIGEAADRLIQLSEALLTLNRLDAQQCPQSEAVALDTIIERVCRLLAPLAGQAQVELCTDLESDCIVWASENEITQVISNLAENAVKYNRPHGSVWITLRKGKDDVEISMEDTGCGIPTEDLSRIFDRFYRVDKARARDAGGTGLGLSIVRDIIKSCGGTITAAQRAGGGSV